jgi:hypothetical protein
MRIVLFLAICGIGTAAFVESPWTVIRKDELADLRAKAEQTAAPVAATPVAAVATPANAWMWQDRPNRLNGPAYGQTYGAPPTTAVAGGNVYYITAPSTVVTQRPAANPTPARVPNYVAAPVGHTTGSH